MGLLYRKTVYEVGDLVSAPKNHNALNKYFPGEIVKVHKRPSVEETHLYAENSIAAHHFFHLLTCGLFYNPKQLYDVKYEDGTVDVELSPKYIRELPQSPADP